MSKKAESAIDQHIREVEEAYLARMKHVGGRTRSGQKQPKDDPHALSRRGVEGQKRAGLAPIHERRRKCAGKRKDDQPCKAAAMTGSKYCKRHGGYRQNPAHPGSIARLMNGKLHRLKAAGKAHKVWKTSTIEERKTVLRTEIPDPRPSSLIINRANGLKALRAAPRDNGEAWRRWIASQALPDNHDDPKYAQYVEYAQKERRELIDD